MPKPDICDFCDSPSVVRRYECMDFRAESGSVGVLYATPEGPTNLVMQSRDYWAACAECARFVDAEDVEGLLKRVTEVLVDAGDGFKGSPLQRQKLIKHLRHTYELFFKTRIRVEA